jgi:hypothetical protein
LAERLRGIASFWVSNDVSNLTDWLLTASEWRNAARAGCDSSGVVTEPSPQPFRDGRSYPQRVTLPKKSSQPIRV